MVDGCSNPCHELKLGRTSTREAFVNTILHPWIPELGCLLCSVLAKGGRRQQLPPLADGSWFDPPVQL
eukprot:scaffold2303_cov243-Pinguiococcus_pyrenoidosus.AAC.1